MPTAEERRTAFRQLHASGCFVMPNPWDVGTARYLQHLGFKALATTSAGFAFSQGLPDADWAVSCDATLAHISEIVAASNLPVNADFESGYADEPEEVEANVKLCAATGVAGLSIEDATGEKAEPLYELELAVERIQAARAALDDAGSDVLLTARAECFLVGHPRAFEESMRRLQAYSEAGADVLYAPGVVKPEEIRAMVSAVQPKPVRQSSDWLERRAERFRSRRFGRQEDQRRRRTCAQCMDRIHSRCNANCRKREFRWFRGLGSLPRFERVLSAAC